MDNASYFDKIKAAAEEALALAVRATPPPGEPPHVDTAAFIARARTLLPELARAVLATQGIVEAARNVAVEAREKPLHKFISVGMSAEPLVALVHVIDALAAMEAA